MKVLFTTNIPSPYRVAFFNELGTHCDLTVVFERDASSERDDSWRKYDVSTFNAIILQGHNVGVDKAICPSILSVLKKNNYDEIILSNFSTPTGWLAITYLKLNRIPYYLESDGGFAGSGKGFKEKFKKFLISGAKGYFSTAKLHDQYYEMYGARHEQLIRYAFTSLFQADILNQPVSIVDKKRIREELGITENKVIVTVGRFIYGKGIDVLIRALDYCDHEIGCYIIGGEVTPEYQELVSKTNLNHVHFLNFMNKEELNQYYSAADLFVLPTRSDVWGLVVNEAMAKGLPVIATNKCIAGTELVRDGKNGFIVPVGDADAIAEKINLIFSEPTLLEDMSSESIRIISEYTIENMAKRHIEILKHL